MTKIQLRRDTASNWSTNNPTPASGEPCFETDTGKLKIGDGTTAYNDLAYQGEEGGSTPDNMVTTDTIQTITGVKTFNPKTGRTVFHDGTTSNYIQIGKDVSTDLPRGAIIFGSSAAGIKGIKTNNSGDTFKISSAGHTQIQSNGNTYITSGIAASSKNGIYIPPISSSSGSVSIWGGSSAQNSSSGADANLKVGKEGTGTYYGLSGVFIDTTNSSSSIYKDKRLWLGELNYRSSIYAYAGTNGRTVSISTNPTESNNSGSLIIDKNSVKFYSADNGGFDLLAAADTKTLVANNCYDFDNPTTITLGASGTSYTMPTTGLLYIQGISTSSSGYVGYKLPDGNFNNTRTPLGSGATLAVTLRVKEGQAIIVQYGETSEIKALVYPCFTS